MTFNLKFLGIGNGFCNNLTNTCAYFKELDKVLIIDCGETVIRKIINNKIFNDVNNVYFIFTHTHSDHIGSLGTVIFYLYFIKHIKVHILLNDNLLYKDNILKLLEIFGISEDMFSIINCQELTRNFKSISTIELYNNKHVDELVSYGIKIVDCYNKSYYYTGDSCDYNLIKLIIKDKTLKRLYLDCSTSNRESKTHMQLSRIDEIIHNSLRKKIYCMHFISRESIDKCKKLGFQVVKN